jgi:hypothetical protein
MRTPIAIWEWFFRDVGSPGRGDQEGREWLLEARAAHRALVKRGKKPTLHRIRREMKRRQRREEFL